MSLSKVIEARRKRAQSFRAFYADRWKNFLRENYETPEEVAANFGVRYQTAVNWWNGDNAPSGHIVSLAYDDHPEIAPRMLGPRAEGV